MSESEFYTVDEILSTISEKGFFYGYKNSYTYTAFDYTLYGIPFDMSEIGKDPIKLVRSMLLYTNVKKLTDMKVHHILFDTFFFDTHSTSMFHFNHQTLIDGLINSLKTYSRINNTVEKVTMQLLVDFLGAKYYTCPKYNYMKSSKTRGSCIFGKSLVSEPLPKLIKRYELNSKKFRFFITYCNAVLNYKMKKNISESLNCN